MEATRDYSESIHPKNSMVEKNGLDFSGLGFWCSSLLTVALTANHYAGEASWGTRRGRGRQTCRLLRPEPIDSGVVWGRVPFWGFIMENKMEATIQSLWFRVSW